MWGQTEGLQTRIICFKKKSQNLKKKSVWKPQYKHSKCYSTNKVFQISDQDKQTRLSINLSLDDHHQCLRQHKSVSILRKKIWNLMGFLLCVFLFCFVVPPLVSQQIVQWFFLLKLHFQTYTCMLSFIAVSTFSPYYPK